MDGKAGAGVYETRIHTAFGIFKAEIHAVEACTLEVAMLDSQVALRALCSNSNEMKLDWNYMTGLKELTTNNITWVPGHERIAGNEAAALVAS